MIAVGRAFVLEPEIFETGSIFIGLRGNLAYLPHNRLMRRDSGEIILWQRLL